MQWTAKVAACLTSDASGVLNDRCATNIPRTILPQRTFKVVFVPDLGLDYSIKPAKAATGPEWSRIQLLPTLKCAVHTESCMIDGSQRGAKIIREQPSSDWNTLERRPNIRKRILTWTAILVHAIESSGLAAGSIFPQ